MPQIFCVLCIVVPKERILAEHPNVSKQRINHSGHVFQCHKGNTCRENFSAIQMSGTMGQTMLSGTYSEKKNKNKSIKGWGEFKSLYEEDLICSPLLWA